MLPQLIPFLPKSYRTYHESFLGGGALFFALQPSKARLADTNAELITCFEAVRDDVEGVIAELRKHRYTDTHFYSVRELDPFSLTPSERAARTIFLNKSGFNGLYRVNRDGKFNVPFGRHKNPLLCDVDNLRACSLALAKTKLHVSDFGAITNVARKDDLVYLDPPYVPLSTTSRFTAYTANAFDEEQQGHLATVFRQLSERGVKAILSNSNTPLVRTLYRDFRSSIVRASRRINSRGSGRGKIQELLIMNY